MTTGLKQVQYPQLDMLAVHQGVRKFNSAKAEQVFDFLGAFQKRIDNASQMIGGHTRALLSECVGLEVVARSAGFSEIFSQWLAIKSNEGLAEVTRNSGLDQIKSIYLKKLQYLRGSAVLGASKLDSLLNDVATINLEHYSDSIMSYDAEKLKQCEAVNDSLKVKIDALAEDQKILDAAIKLLQSRTWWDHAKDILPTDDEIEVALKAALVGAADADLIKMAIGRLTKYVDLIGGGFKLLDMFDAKMLIIADLQRETLALKNNKKDMDGLRQRAEKIATHTELVASRDLWVTTITSIHSSLQQFIDVCESMSSATDEAITQAPKQQADFANFLRSLNK